MAKSKKNLKAFESLQKSQDKVLVVGLQETYLLEKATTQLNLDTVKKIERVFIPPALILAQMQSGNSENIDVEAYINENFNTFSEEEQALYFYFKVTCATKSDRDTLLEELKTREDILSVEIDPIAETNMIPNDPEYPNLWGLQKINATKVWDCAKGAGAVVAIVDTGIDYTHTDLDTNMWESSPGVHGWNFTSDNAGPNGNIMDGNSHGTHVAGTVAAKGNNNHGVIGVAPEARLMGLKGLSNFGGGTFTALANCISTAAGLGANIINNSWGCRGRCPNVIPSMHAAISYADSLGATIVFAAGNSNDDVQFYYPQNDRRTLTVGATDQSDSRAGFSNYGSLVDVAAPGVTVLSTVPGNGFASYSGTSMAAPHVSGMAALILGKDPSLSPAMVQTIIESYVAAIQPDQYIGTGRIELEKLGKLICDCKKTKGPCAINKAISENELEIGKQSKFKEIPALQSSTACTLFHKEGACTEIDIPGINPCFSFHWGDSPRDQIETHDTEIVYITVCNPFSNINFKGLTITKLTILPNYVLPNGEPAIQIVPSKLICYENIESCSCSTREYALLTNHAPAGSYTIQFEYCIDEITITNSRAGKDAFPIELISS